MVEQNDYTNRRMDGPVRRVRRLANVPARKYPVSEPFKPVEPITLTVTPVVPKPLVAPSRTATTEASKTPRIIFAHHWKRRAALSVALILLVTGSVLGFKAVLATQRIVTRNAGPGAPALAGSIDPTKLRGEGDGRINILMLGIGGQGHDGSNLSDTMMVASIDPNTKNVAMLSIPRDLYVKIPGYGGSKINAANAYGGPELAKKVVSQMLDLPIHYYVQVDFAGFKQAVDSVNGVDILNTANLYDPEYPCENERGYCTFKLIPGQYHMDGKAALRFSRCRHGSCGGDFGRAARQQMIMVALRQKALEASTLTNPVKLAGLIDSAGSHLKTDLKLDEMKKLAAIIKDIDIAKATQKVLDETPAGLLVAGSGQFPGAGSIELPRAGAFNYTEIQELVHSIFIDGFLKQENAAIEIQNGTAKEGLAAAVVKQLSAYNYNVLGAKTAAEQTHAVSTIYDYTSGKKPYTVKYLEARFGVKAQQAAAAPAVAGQQSPDITVIVGNDYRVSVPISVQ